MSLKDCPTIDPMDFKLDGYLSEVNRQFFHPLGLALAVQHPGTVGRVRSMWRAWKHPSSFTIIDSRDDPEGITFVGVDLEPNANRVAQEWERRSVARIAALGYMVQPVDAGGPDE